MTHDELLDATDQLARASAIASIAHRDQVDKAGEPYLGHVERVAGMFDAAHWVERCIALLHDTIEDSDITADDLLRAGVHRQVLDAVVLLTRTVDVSPADYYARISSNPTARLVKLADLADNTNPERLARLDSAVAARLKAKYAAAHAALAGGIHD
jgi:(p)ppGpp synthase/HD superfamily hydrolase